MADAYSLPSWPPESPWEAYILALVIPLFLRIWLLRRPLLDLIEAYAPTGERKRHLNWFRENIDRIPVRGFGGLLRQEVFAFVLPTIAAAIARIAIGEIGWQSWDEVPQFAAQMLVLALVFWILWDFLRVMRTRRSLKRLSRLNLEKLKRGIERALRGREILRGLERFRIPRPWKRVIDVDHEVDGEIVKVDEPNFISKIIFGLLDRGVDLIDGSLGVVKKPAVGIADAIESRMQAIVDSHIRTTRDTMFRNIIFSLFPLFILRIYPEIF